MPSMSNHHDYGADEHMEYEYNIHMDTRGTQTDMVTDRNIADCLMELKSSAEFQDLTYRLSRSCTGEMTLIVTRDNTVGLLGPPFDPVCVTVTASGICYFSVLFTPVEVINLKPNGDLNLRKFRHILWKLNGRAGYGFCPGFTQMDFPKEFQFEAYGLEVLQQPFTRVQAKGCRVFLQMRRSSARAVSQPLGLQLCSVCLKTLTDLYTALKNKDEVLSSLPVFDKFLPLQSCLSSRTYVSQQPNSRIMSKTEGLDENSKCDPLNAGDVPDAEENTDKIHNSNIVSKVAADWSADILERKASLEDPNSNIVRGCRVLLDGFVPLSSGPNAESDNNSEAWPYNTPESSMSPTNQFAENIMSSVESFTSASPAQSSSFSAQINDDNMRQLKQTFADSPLSRPILSARIKPFRTIVPHGKEVTEIAIAEGGDVVIMESSHSGTAAKRQKTLEMSPEAGPPVLTPEMMLSPSSSPQPLLIDEDADSADMDTAMTGPETKRSCFQCSMCEKKFYSQTALQQHFSQQHQPETDLFVSIPTPPVCDVADRQMSPAKESVQWPYVKLCPICQGTFQSKEELETHLISRHHARLHRCRFCGQKFALKKNLADHLERHRGSKKFTCNECGCKFTKKKEFAAHVRQHMGRLPYFCPVCSKFFSRENVYEEHIERHRMGRGVRALLSGNEKVLQGIVSKAKRCLEEKAVMTPSTATTVVTVSPPSQTVNSPSPLTMLTSSFSDPLPAPPSNLHLLSAVSLAQAELDRQPKEGNVRKMTISEEMSAAMGESNQAAAQILHLSSPQTNVHHTLSGCSSQSLRDPGQTVISNKCQMSESETEWQRLQSPLQQPKSSLVPSEGQAASYTEPQEAAVRSLNNFSNPLSKEPLDAVGILSEENGALKSNSKQQDSAKIELEKLLADREQKVKKKEHELKEREIAITRKNMIIFQKLLMAHLSQQSKTGNGAAGCRVKGDKPVLQQAMTMFTMLNNMASGEIGQGAQLVRPPALGSLPGPGKAKSSSHNVSSFVQSQTLGLGEKGFKLKDSSTARKSQPSAGVVCIDPSFKGSIPSKTISQSLIDATPTCSSFTLDISSSPLLKQIPVPCMSTQRPPPPPSVHAVTQKSSSASNRPVQSSDSQPSAPSFCHGMSFLEQLMKLESKMPASAKEFLPYTMDKKQSTRPAKSLLPIMLNASSTVLHSEVNGKIAMHVDSKGKSQAHRTNMSDVIMDYDEQPSRGKFTGPLQGKLKVWSGGRMKEKLSSVGTAVSPQEVKRLLSLNLKKLSVAIPASDLPSVSLSEPLTGLPSLSSPLSPAIATTVTVSSLSAALSPPDSSKASMPSLLSHTSPTSKSNLQPMPHLIPVTVHASVSSQGLPWMPAVPVPSVTDISEEEVPMDLTKGSSSKAMALERQNDSHYADTVTSQQSVVLRRVLLEPPLSRDQMALPALRTKLQNDTTSISPVLEGSRHPSQDLVHLTSVNPQIVSAAVQAQASAAAQDPKFKSEGLALLQHFMPYLVAEEVTVESRNLSSQRILSPQTRIALSPQPLMVTSGSGTQVQTSLPQDVTTSVSRQANAASSLLPALNVTLPVAGSCTPAVVTVFSDTNTIPSSVASVGATISSPRTRSLMNESAIHTTVSSSPTSISMLTSHSSSAATATQSVISPIQCGVPNFLLPPHTDTSSTLEQLKQKLEVRNHPLGGFAWHRPASVDPFQTFPGESNCTAAKRPVESSQTEEIDPGLYKGKNDEEIDLTADHNLWQQQFLQTLREKRRHQQEQQQRQQQVLQTNMQPLIGQKLSEQHEWRRKKSAHTMVEGKTVSSHILSNLSSSMSRAYVSSAQQSRTDLVIASSLAELSTTQQATIKANSKANRGKRPRGRPRKNAVQTKHRKEDITGVILVGEEGAEFPGPSKTVDIKVETLEGDVHCDGCGKLFCSEADILGHDCNAL